ncbi:hypothetical protein BJ138DRAFT_1139364 [Hygrophoropsis aurantiaca]|uniref:Uncharacterized protein n=1 Tax=Hygrophoropsis aurantiaca TaxID=72124 RepID=A0ACB8AUW8_9AGAM|nr:hypothetical protein BJ138DRAFT_1139364 [Hygrophoropsis aurantiaca]
MYWILLTYILPILLFEATLFVPVQGSTQTFLNGPTPADDYHEDLAPNWRLDIPSHPNTTGRLVFETASSLLQHWPNTRYRNGHTIVPGIIRPGTLLYHGTFNSEIPDTPDWTATDPEHSLVFCRGSIEAGCWHLTLAATRPLRVLYFDGNSGAKIEGEAGGTMDSQDIIIWGEPRPDKAWNERERLDKLCAWGKQYELDGFVRQQMDFEVMICDFSAGLEVVSFANLASLRLAPPPFTENSTKDERLMLRAMEMLRASSWHHRYPGETRVQLDLSRLISFYDTSLFPSLISQRAGQERWDHRLLGLSVDDRTTLMSRLDEVLTAREQDNSDIDWITLLRVIIERHADRLELLQELLEEAKSTLDLTKLQQTAHTIQLELRVMVTAYALRIAVPPNASMLHEDWNSWAAPVFKECSIAHTAFMQSRLLTRLTPSERLLLGAVQETTREICRVVVGMWAEGVKTGFDIDLWIGARSEAPSITVTRMILDEWSTAINGLMAWLDWNIWVKCKPPCNSLERCHIPTWPFGFPHRVSEELMHEPSVLDRLTYSFQEANSTDWRRPQPKCIRRVHPYDGF